MINKTIKRITVFALIGSLVNMTGCDSGAAKTNYELGFEALNNQNFNEALSYLTSAENDNENKQLVYRGEGMANLGLGNYDEAVSCFENALHESNGLVKSVDYDINFYLAAAQYKKGDLNGAMETYKSISELDKKNVNACYLIGKTALDMGMLDEAKAGFDKALSIDSTDPYIYINIYNELFNKGYDVDAKSYINLALKNVPKPGSYILGIFNYYLGDYTQARNYFEDSKDTKKTAEGMIYLGKTYEALGDSGYAATLYESFLNENPGSSEMYNELGNLRFNEKDYEGAISVYEKGLKSEDISYRQALMFNRIVAYEYMKDYKTAATLMNEYIATYPDDEEAKREDIFLRTR